MSLPTPVQTKTVFIDGDPDRFDQEGRHYYMSVTQSSDMDSQYNGLLAALGPKQLLVLNMGIRTPQALLVVDRAEVDDEIKNAADQGTLSWGPEVTKLDHLNTHPEYDWMTHTEQSAKDWWKLGGDGTVADITGPHGAVFNLSPRFLKVEDPATGNMDAWVLAAPCGKVWCDPTWPGMNPGSQAGEWGIPDPYWLGHQGEAMVQFWPVDVVNDAGGNPDHLDVVTTMTTHATRPGNSGLPRMFGPDPGMAFEVESVILDKEFGEGTTMASYCIVADWGGRILISEITDILSGAPDAELTLGYTWDDYPPSTLDTQFQNVTFVTPDVMDDDQTAYLYVGVRRGGVQILKFTPSDTGNELTEVDFLQTTSSPFDAVIRNDGGVKHLIVTDSHGGLRVYGD